MRTVHTLLFLLFLFLTASSYAQSNRYQSQDSINATTQEKIRQLETATDRNSDAIAAAVMEMAAMRSSLDRFTGLGMGIGAALAALQGLLIIVTYKNGGRKV